RRFKNSFGALFFLVRSDFLLSSREKSSAISGLLFRRPVTPSCTTKLCGRVSCGVRCVVRLVRSISPTLTATTKGVRCNFGLFSSRAAAVPCTSTCSAGGHVRRSCRASKICQQQQRTNTVDPKVQIQTK
ncbi:unnamed protein product, partial [Ixodes pacificus]